MRSVRRSVHERETDTGTETDRDQKSSEETPLSP